VYNLPELLKQINWVDALFIVIFLGTVLRGAKTGVGSQLLALAGWVAIMYVSVRYHPLVSEAIFGFMLQGWAKPLSFFAVAAAGFVVQKLVERIFSAVLASELSIFEKLGGAVVAGVKAVVLCGMIVFFLLLVPVDYMVESVMEGSKSSLRLLEVDAVLYRAIDGLLLPEEGKESDRDAFDEFIGEKGSYTAGRG